MDKNNNLMKPKQKLTREQIESHLDKIINYDFKRGVSAVTWMGITISWKRKPKYLGGTISRNKTWGIWEYQDALNDKDLTRDEAIATILQPLKERVSKQDLTNIKYCASCGNIAIGEEEQLLWGILRYAVSITTYKSKINGKVIGKYVNTKWANLCHNCCIEILNATKSNKE